MADTWTKTTLDCIEEDGSFSVKKQRYMLLDDVVTEVGPPERRAFVPGEFAELGEYAPQFKAAADYLWTKDRVDAWQIRQRRG